MSREWVDDMVPPPRRGPDTRDRRWVMRCDRFGEDGRCPTEVGPPSRTQPDLMSFVVAGWFIAHTHGDLCPACLAAGHKPSTPPSPLMADLSLRAGT